MKLRKLIWTTAAFVFGTSLFAQAADDGFIVPLNEDFSNASGTVAATVSTGSSSGSSILQGLWIEASSDNGFLIRDIAEGKKKGYEFDNSHLISKANWWFWGDINSNFHLDAEIGVWKFDKTLYQANTFGANVPDVSWGDGLQSLGSMIYAPFYEMNDEGLGAFNKMGLAIKTPYVNAKVGYGNLKNGGMSEFTGIYTVLNRWDDVGHGFTEISNGSKIQQFGDWKMNALIAFSRMLDVSSQPFGMYDVLDFKYAEKAEIAATFGSSTTESDLFFYDRTNTNAVSLYGKYNVTDSFSVELHGLGTFGTDVDFDSTAMAGAFRVKYNSEKIDAALKASWAGENVNSIWGNESTDNNNINADCITGQLDFTWRVADLFSFTIDESLTINDVDSIGDGLINLRSQPCVDFDLNSATEIDILIGAYGIIQADRLDSTDFVEQNFVPYFAGAGVELTAADLGFANKIVFDYAVNRTMVANSAKDGYEQDMLYNSFMIKADLTDNIDVHLGGLFNVKKDSDDSFIPFGVAAGLRLKKTPLPGHPQFWAHCTYGMNPYEDNDYSMYRADQANSDSIHRNYLLNTLDTENASRIAFGFMWDLQ